MGRLKFWSSDASRNLTKLTKEELAFLVLLEGKDDAEPFQRLLMDLDQIQAPNKQPKTHMAGKDQKPITVYLDAFAVAEFSRSDEESHLLRIASRASRIHGFISKLLPQWFSICFGESLIDDLFNIAKEEGGNNWKLKLIIVASQFVLKFAWRRFERRKAAEKSSSLTNNRDDGA